MVGPDRVPKAGAFADLRRALTDDAFAVVPIPALCMLLFHLEKVKGSALTEAEVLAARDEATAIIMLSEHRDQLVETRGPDLDPDNVWLEWQEFRAALDEEEI